MRSRVVPIQDMRYKYKTEVKAFAYAFVIANHAPGWDNRGSVNTQVDQEIILVPLFPKLETFPAPENHSVLSPGGKPAVNIEVKSRN